MCTLLTKALKGLHNIRNITLDARVVTGIDRRFETWYIRSFLWRVQWPRAFQAYQVLLAAVTYSQSQLDSFVIFQNERTKKCSISTHEISVPLVQRLEKEGFAAVGSRLKKYSVSLAMTTLPPELHDRESISEELKPVESRINHAFTTNDQTALSKVDFEGVSSLLRLMPNLEFLQIDMYPEDLSNSVTACHSFLPTLLQENWHFPHLKELRLLGIFSTQEALQELILRHAATLQVLSLENVVLTNGWWGPVFATLSQQAVSLASLRLSLLGVGESRVGVNLEPVDRVSDGRSSLIGV
jgi:hypothetical protein